jgi:hypothetical protein
MSKPDDERGALGAASHSRTVTSNSTSRSTQASASPSSLGETSTMTLGTARLRTPRTNHIFGTGAISISDESEVSPCGY